MIVFLQKQPIYVVFILYKKNIVSYIQRLIYVLKKTLKKVILNLIHTHLIIVLKMQIILKQTLDIKVVGEKEQSQILYQILFI